MTHSTIACPQCGADNPTHRLWCRQCGRSVPARPAPPPAQHRSDTERAMLYQRLLTDIEEVSGAQKIDRQTYDVIKDFSQDQIKQIEHRTHERQRLYELHQLVTQARAAANSERFQKAVEILQSGLARDRGEYQLREMIDEVHAKIQQREQKLKAKRESESLYHEAKALIDSDRLVEAEDKLKQARQLVSGDTRLIAALQQTHAQIAHQREHQLAQARAQERAQQAAQADVDQAPSIAPPVAPPKLPCELVAQSTVAQSTVAQPTVAQPTVAQPTAAQPTAAQPTASPATYAPVTFADEAEIATPVRRLIESASQWSSVVKPFLLDNFGWFVGAFLVIAGFVVLIVTFWGRIEQNQILMHSLVYISVAAATGLFFALAYFMRLKYPDLETSSNVLLVIVALLIPLLFMAAMLTSFIPVTPVAVAFLSTAG